MEKIRMHHTWSGGNPNIADDPLQPLPPPLVIEGNSPTESNRESSSSLDEALSLQRHSAVTQAWGGEDEGQSENDDADLVFNKRETEKFKESENNDSAAQKETLHRNVGMTKNPPLEYKDNRRRIVGSGKEFTSEKENLPHELRRNKSTGSSAYYLDREYDVFLLHVSDDREIAKELRSRLEEEKLRWCDYDHSFAPNESVIDNIGKMLFTSKRTLVILSPGFYDSKLFMYFLNVTVKCCVDHGEDSLIPVLHNSTLLNIPTWLNIFGYFQSDHKFWMSKVIKGLKSPVKQLDYKGHPDIEQVSDTIRSVNSEPSTLIPKLSETTRQQMRIWMTATFRNLPRKCTGLLDAAIREDEEQEVKSIESRWERETEFALKLRRKGKDVYDCGSVCIKEGFNVSVGDVLELCETCVDGENVRVRNSHGQEGIIQKHLLLPNVFFLPNAAIEWARHPISSTENSDFETLLREMGHKVYRAIDKSAVQNQQKICVNKDDVVAILPSEGGKFVKVKNCRNEIGFVLKRLLREK